MKKTKANYKLDNLIQRYIDYKIIDNCSKRFNDNNVNHINKTILTAITAIALLIVLSIIVF